MKVTMEFIDHRGFWHVRICNGKRKAIESLKALHPGTEIYWKDKKNVMVSQQYVGGRKN